MEECKRNFNIVMDYDCPHRGHSERLLCQRKVLKRVPCLCMQLYRTKGVALIDSEWHTKTDAMRVGWEVLEDQDPNFEWEEATFLRDVKVFIPFWCVCYNYMHM